MFSVGDKIIYGGMGVCTVKDICVPDIPGAERLCYILEPHHVSNSKVYAPVKDNPVKIRSLLTQEEAHSLIDSLPMLSPFPAGIDKQEMHNICRTAIKTADSHVLAKLLKTLYEKKQRILQQRKIVPISEKEYFETAEKMLFGEFSVVLSIPVDTVQSYITSRLGPNYLESAPAVS